MDQLERHLRDVLSSERRALDPSLVSLERVHARATSRHRRRVALTASATGLTVLAAAGIGFAIGGQSGGDRIDPLAPTGEVSHSPGPSSSPSVPSASPAVTGPAWDGARVISMTATSTRTIVVLGALGDTGKCTPPDCVRLAESHDGGQTFDALPIPEGVTGGGGSGKVQTAVTGVRFGSAEDGWLFGGGFWSTHDGGHSWNPLPMPGYVTRLEAASGFAWALVSNGHDIEQLWTSPVGTDDWARVPGVQVIGPADLAVQGERVTVVGANGSSAWSNSSGSFRKSDNPCSSALEVELSASAGIWAKCATGTAAYLAQSADGVNWKTVQFDTGGGSPPNSMVVGARTADEALVWLGNGDTPLSLLQADGTLTPVASPPGTGITWMGFTTKDIGYAITCCSIQTLLRTDDGGSTWTDAGPG
jgi:hypothetical protein